MYFCTISGSKWKLASERDYIPLHEGKTNACMTDKKMNSCEEKKKNETFHEVLFHEVLTKCTCDGH